MSPIETFNQFVAGTQGMTDIGDTSANHGECVGLVEAFFDLLGLPHIWGNACDMPADADRNVFDVISNTATYIPPVCSAVAWPAGWEGSSVGHVALVAPGTTVDKLVVYEANDRIGGGNGGARMHTFDYATGLTVAQIAAGWPKFIVPRILNEPPVPNPVPPPIPVPVATPVVAEPTPVPVTVAPPAATPEPISVPQPLPATIPAAKPGVKPATKISAPTNSGVWQIIAAFLKILFYIIVGGRK